MSKVTFVSLFNWLYSFNLFILTFSLILSGIVFYGSKFYNAQNLSVNTTVSSFIKFLLLVTLSVSFFINLYIFWAYSNFVNYKTLANVLFVSKSFNFRQINDSISFNYYNYIFSLELVGIVFTLLVYMVGIISFLALDSRMYWKNIRFTFICYFLVLAVVVFCSTNDLLIFFIMYEALLLPSFFFVYYIAPNRRAVQASIYFLIWTHVGSFLVLCAVCYVIVTTGTTSFGLMKSFIFTNTEINIIYLLLFVGFGIKVPIWPAHYWITKTHVEAPAGFSIFLSGFLVKSAVYGFYKISNLLGGNASSLFASTLCYVGVLDASFKMWSQTDLKKLVAYATIQEMNLIYLTVCWGDGVALLGGLIFCITHAFLSSLFFYLVDCVQRRFNSRSILEVSGLIHLTPNLGLSILAGLILYSGLPGTLKFISEFYIFSGLLESSPLSCCILLFSANFFGLLGFLKCWLNCVFGLSAHNQDKIPADLTFKEFLIIFICLFCLFFFTFSIKVFI